MKTGHYSVVCGLFCVFLVHIEQRSNNIVLFSLIVRNSAEFLFHFVGRTSAVLE